MIYMYMNLFGRTNRITFWSYNVKKYTAYMLWYYTYITLSICIIASPIYFFVMEAFTNCVWYYLWAWAWCQMSSTILSLISNSNKSSCCLSSLTSSKIRCFSHDISKYHTILRLFQFLLLSCQTGLAGPSYHILRKMMKPFSFLILFFSFISFYSFSILVNLFDQSLFQTSQMSNRVVCIRLPIGPLKAQIYSA